MTLLAKIALIQLSSTSCVEQNLEKAGKMLKQAANQQAQLAVLPENFAALGHENSLALAQSEWQGCGIVRTWLSEQAKKLQIEIVAGSVPLLRAAHDSKPYAASLLLNTQGQEIARYDKLHLFDAAVGDQKQRYVESEHFAAGQEIVVAKTQVGQLGMSICYDLRFALQFHALREAGAQFISVPSAFTVPTGQAHWQILLQARAIETQCFILAANQTGQHSATRASFGHSMIISPWGEILAHADTEEGIVVAECDLNYLQQIRDKMPVLAHQRFALAKLKSSRNEEF